MADFEAIKKEVKALVSEITELPELVFNLPFKI